MDRYNRASNVLAIADENIGLLNLQNKLSPGLNSSVLACIVRNESNTFYPESINYTFCDEDRSKRYHPKPRSTAHGLGQCTQGRFNDLRQRGIIDEPPLSNDKDVERHYFLEMNSRPGMQMKIMAQDFNHMLETKDLMSAVAKYDQDRQSRYLCKFRLCQQCFSRYSTRRQKVEQCLLDIDNRTYQIREDTCPQE